MKLLIIGCGSIGSRHARCAAQLGRFTIAICDPNPKMTQPLAEELGITEIYTDMDEAIRLSGADAAIVCTPNHLHAAPSIAAMKAGMHVLCEKPIATSLEDAAAMVEASRETGKMLMVGYTLRCTMQVQKTKELLDSGKLGRILAARVVLNSPDTLTCARSPFRAKYETGGGIVYDYTHQLDYCRYFFGDAKRCIGLISSRCPEKEACDDNAEGIVEYDGLTVNYHWDYIQYNGLHFNTTTIVGEKGALDFVGVNKVVITYYDGSKEEYSFEPDLERNLYFRRQLGKFEQYCAEGSCPGVCTGYDAYEDLRLADMLYKSSREGVRIEL